MTGLQPKDDLATKETIGIVLSPIQPTNTISLQPGLVPAQPGLGVRQGFNNTWVNMGSNVRANDVVTIQFAPGNQPDTLNMAIRQPNGQMTQLATTAVPVVAINLGIGVVAGNAGNFNSIARQNPRLGVIFSAQVTATVAGQLFYQVIYAGAPGTDNWELDCTVNSFDPQPIVSNMTPK